MQLKTELAIEPGSTVTLTCNGNAGPAGAKVTVVKRKDHPTLGPAHDVRGVWGGAWWCLADQVRASV